MLETSIITVGGNEYSIKDKVGRELLETKQDKLTAGNGLELKNGVLNMKLSKAFFLNKMPDISSLADGQVFYLNNETENKIGYYKVEKGSIKYIGTTFGTSKTFKQKFFCYKIKDDYDSKYFGETNYNLNLSDDNHPTYIYLTEYVNVEEGYGHLENSNLSLPEDHSYSGYYSSTSFGADYLNFITATEELSYNNYNNIYIKDKMLTERDLFENQNIAYCRSYAKAIINLFERYEEGDFICDVLNQAEETPVTITVDITDFDETKKVNFTIVTSDEDAYDITDSSEFAFAQFTPYYDGNSGGGNTSYTNLIIPNGRQIFSRHYELTKEDLIKFLSGELTDKFGTYYRYICSYSDSYEGGFYYAYPTSLVIDKVIIVDESN